MLEHFGTWSSLKRYDWADLQPKALRTTQEALKGESSFVPKTGEKLSSRGIEASMGHSKTT